MTYPETFEGFGSPSNAEWNKTKKFSYKPKTFEAHDVDIKIECCGICGSDIHCGKGDWGDPYRPIVLGHEIVGTVVNVGSEVTEFKIGQRVGVGALCKSCKTCNRCKNGDEPYCDKFVHTYMGFFEDGTGSQGGYASHIRCDDDFVFAIPENIASEDAAPFLCAGVTSFSPMVRYGVGPGKTVAVSGIGGVGHLAIMLAKALGAEVYAISRNLKKKEDAEKLGADHFIATDKEGWEIENFDKIDVLINCSSSLTDIDFTKMAKIMHVKGTIISISAPDASEILTMSPIALVGCTLGVTHVGSKREIIQMLDLISKNNLKPWLEKVPISEAGVNEVLTRADKGDVKYRFVLTDYDKEFK